jgi:zinc metalloprotease ZmpB
VTARALFKGGVIMTFDLTSKVQVQRDERGIVRKLSHPMEPYGASQATALGAAAEISARALADEYVREVLPTLSLEPEMADSLDAGVARTSVRADEGPKLRNVEEKVAEREATISYAQTAMGLEVWQAGLSVRMRGAPYQVVGAQNSIHYDLDVKPPPPDAPYLGDRVDVTTLVQLLQLSPDAARPTIDGTHLLIYAYDPENRGNGSGPSNPPDESNMDVGFPTLTLPPLPDTLEATRHYVVTEVLFKLALPGWEPLNWSAFIEPVTGAVLYLRVFVACVDGLVLLRDPITASGDTATTPTSPTQVLDSLRASVALEGLDPPGSMQELRGEFVRLTDVSVPGTPAPTRPPGSDFNFPFPTDDFAAVNAYHHCDSCFRTLAGLGFNVAEFFPSPGTTFPVRVDHRATINPFGGPNQVNASAPGTSGGLGSDGFRFALLAPGSTAGMAVEARVTWHEFGHAVLYGHLHSPNFRFAHSIGDTLAAIVHDPASQASGTLQGRTFPWTIVTRRHDHAPSSGFAWGGTQDAPQPVGASGPDRAGYQREQILSSSLFRFYRSLGGGHADLAVREFASRLSLHLIFDAIRSLSFVAPPQNAADLVDAMMEADLLMAPFEGHPAGTMHKVVRWAFEQQGLYQPPGAPLPVTGPGAPPEIDVYIDDGRGDGYQEAQSFPSEAPDVWCRRSSGGGTIHEAPLFGQDNFVYVQVRNRGSQPADDAVVRVFASRDATDRTWPTQ